MVNSKFIVIKLIGSNPIKSIILYKVKSLIGGIGRHDRFRIYYK